MRRAKAGYTLIELMIVVAIISILAAVLVPKFADSIRHGQEAATKGNLGVLNGALTSYYALHEGVYPQDHLESLVNERLLDAIPKRFVPPYHTPSNTVGIGYYPTNLDTGEGWFYASQPDCECHGRVFVNCVHHDLRGKTWSSY